MNKNPPILKVNEGEEYCDIKHAAEIQRANKEIWDAAVSEAKEKGEPNAIEMAVRGREFFTQNVEIENPFFDDGWAEIGWHELEIQSLEKMAADSPLQQEAMDRLVNGHKEKIAEIMARLGINAGPVMVADDAKDRSAPTKPIQRSAAQDAAIMDAMREAGFDPQALSKNAAGKPGQKAVVRAALKGNSLFLGTSVFDKAWERLFKNGDIAYKP